MKYKFAVLALMALCSCVGSQAAKQTRIETTIAFPGHSKEQIYTVLKHWFSTQLASEDMKIDTDNREGGRLTGSTKIKYPCRVNEDCAGKKSWRLGLTVQGDVQNQQIVLSVTNMRLSIPSVNTETVSHRALDRPLTEDEIDNDARPTLIKLSNDLRVAIENEPVVIEK
ncbi:MAG: DUF4468 domain-containing protein [Pseudomonadota bacterium]